MFTPEEAWEFSLLCLCNFREARGEIILAKRAQAWSVRNRVMNPSWYGTDYPSVILKHAALPTGKVVYQYSCFNQGDPNSVIFPAINDTAWQACLNVCADVYAGIGDDPSLGATHYFDRSLDETPPDWAKDGSLVHLANVGNLRFWGRAKATSA